MASPNDLADLLSCASALLAKLVDHQRTRVSAPMPLLNDAEEMALQLAVVAEHVREPELQTSQDYCVRH